VLPKCGQNQLRDCMRNDYELHNVEVMSSLGSFCVTCLYFSQ